MSKKILTPMTITATDSDSRTITGRIVAFNEPGNTSWGKTEFAPGSIEATSIMLNLEHDQTRRIGKTLSIESTDKEIIATFKIAATTAGNDALIEAAEGLRDGFSVECMVDEYDTLKDGTMRILVGELVGCALTSEPAIRSARVSSVAASENEIPGAIVVPGEVEGETQVEPTVPTGDATVETVVEAKEVTAKSAYIGGATTKPRSPIMNAATYAEHTIKGFFGNEDSRQYVAFADDTYTTNAAFDQATYWQTVVDPSTKFGRPAVDAVGGAMVTKFKGQTIRIPKVTTVSTVTVEAEEGATSETGIVSSFVDASVLKYAGMQTFTQELYDLSSDSPIWYDMMVKNITAAYAKATNAAVITELLNGTAGANQAATLAGMIVYHGTESAAAYLATGDFATSYLAGSSQWVLAMNGLDSTGRPIFNSIAPSNNAGDIKPTSARGRFLDLDFYVDRGMVATTIDDSALIIVPSAFFCAEMAPQKLQVAQLGTGQYELSIHGYMANKVLIADGIRRFQIA